MDVANVAATSTNISDAGVSQAVAIELLKKATNANEENALALIQAVPQAPSTPNLPPNLGNNINTTA